MYSIRIDGMKPDHLALMLIANVIGDELSTGSYHVYRGVLGAVGNDMLKLWNATISALKERGYYSDAEVEEDMRWIREQISNAG